MLDTVNVELGFPELLTAKTWGTVSRVYSLTPQEINVLRLLTRGFANSEIAHQLGICGPTVRSHLRSAYRKIGQSDRLCVVLHLVHAYR